MLLKRVAQRKPSLVRGASQPERLSFELSVFLRKLLDLDELICIDISEILPRSTCRPANLQISDLGRPFQPDVLLKRGSAKRAAAPDSAADGASWLVLILHGQMDAHPNCRAVRFNADKFHRDPVVVASRILEDAECLASPGVAPPRPKRSAKQTP